VPDVDDQHASADLQHPRDLARGDLALAGVVDVVQRHAGEHDVEAGVVERKLACVGGLHLDAIDHTPATRVINEKIPSAQTISRLRTAVGASTR
jgi:hypothetical protein